MKLSRLIFRCALIAASIALAIVAGQVEAEGVSPKVSIAITQATDHAFCESFVAHGKAARWTALTGIPQEIENGDGIDFLHGAKEILPDAPTERVEDDYAEHYHMDLDNDGRGDEVLWVWSDKHYFRGDYIMLLPPEGNPLRELALRPRGDEDVAPYLARLRQAGLAVYSGSATPYVRDLTDGADRYTHFLPVTIAGTTYLWARSENEDIRPQALLYRPGPGGRLDPVCTFDWAILE